MGITSCSSAIPAGTCICDDLGGGVGGSGGGGTGGGGAVGGGTGGSSGGGGGGGGGGGALPSITLQQFCAEYPAAACATRIACGRYSDAGMDLCLERESVTELCRRASLGFVNFSGQGAALCLTQLQSGALNCASDFAPCGHVLKFGAGAPTPFDIFTQRPNGCGTMTCGAGTRCDDRCTGPQCLPPLDAGAECDGADGIIRDCPAGTTCASPDGGAYTCEPFAPRGGDCSRLGCSELDVCNYGLTPPTCIAKLPNEAACGPADTCMDGVCRADGHCGARDAGASCLSAIECGASFDSEFICLGLQLTADGGTQDAGVCSPRPRRGEACSRDWARPYDSCRVEDGEACLDGVCTLLTPFSRPLGAECLLRPWGYTAVPFFGFTVCERGLGCVPSASAHPPQTGRCQPAKVEGSACLDEFECAPGLSCFPGEDGGSRCTTLAGLGQPCDFRGCLRDFSCDLQTDGGRVCESLSPVDGGCASQTCVPSAQCVSGVCEPLGGTGATCVFGFQCQSEVCQLNRCVDQCLR